MQPVGLQEGGHGVLRVSLQGLSAGVCKGQTLVRNKRWGPLLCWLARECVGSLLVGCAHAAAAEGKLRGNKQQAGRALACILPWFVGGCVSSIPCRLNGWQHTRKGEYVLPAW